MARETPSKELLRRVWLFADLPDTALDPIARQTTERTYDAGEVIVRQGEHGIGFYLVAEGEVEVSQDGRPLRTLWAGDFFGELALLEETPRTATVTALTQTRCLLLPRWHFRALLQERPDLAVRLLERTVRRLREQASEHS
jgi:CRP/FNR family transcriptional regulator